MSVAQTTDEIPRSAGRSRCRSRSIFAPARGSTAATMAGSSAIERSRRTLPAECPSRADACRVHSTVHRCVATQPRRSTANSVAAKQRRGERDARSGRSPTDGRGVASSLIGRRTAAAAPANSLKRLVEARRRRNRARACRRTAARHRPPATAGSWTAAPRPRCGSAGRAAAGRRCRAPRRARLVDRVGSSSPAAAFAASSRAARGDFAARAVVERDDQGQAVVAGGPLDRARSSRSTSSGPKAV